MGELDRFRDEKTVVVTTYRRDGRPVDTPVHIAVVGDDVYIRTYESAMKWKRLRRNPDVVISRANVGHWPPILALAGVKLVRRVGEGVAAHAVLLDGEEAARGASAMKGKYPFLQGFLTPWIHRNVFHTRTLNLKLVAGAHG